MKQTKILITCALGDYMKTEVDLIKSINDDDLGEIIVIGVDAKDKTYDYINLDKFYKVHSIDHYRYYDEIYNLCKEEKINLLIPTHTSELQFFHDYRHIFELIGTKVMVTGGELDIANDKIKCRDFMVDNKMPVPVSTVVKNFDQYKKFVSDYPDKTFCIKLRDNCGGRGFYVIRDSEYTKDSRIDKRSLPEKTLNMIFDENKEFLLQEYLPNDEYTVDILSENGKFICGATKKNFSMGNGVAEDSTIVYAPEILQQCTHLAYLLKLDGNIGFDLKEGSDGNVYIIDVNPRLTATVSLIVKSGLDIVHLGIRKSLGLKIPDTISEAKVGTSIHRKLYDVFEYEGGLI